jgi:hypothetical protein
MSTRRKFVLITLLLGALAFLFGPNAPLGGLVWPEPVGLSSDPTGLQTGLFALLFAVTALAFGAGSAFALLCRPAVRDAFGPRRRGLATAVHISIVWILWNWWLHDGLHMVNDSTGGLLAIEYAFHVTIMVAGVILAYAVVVLAGDRQQQTAPLTAMVDASSDRGR